MSLCWFPIQSSTQQSNLNRVQCNTEDNPNKKILITRMCQRQWCDGHETYSLTAPDGACSIYPLIIGIQKSILEFWWQDKSLWACDKVSTSSQHGGFKWKHSYLSPNLIFVWSVESTQREKTERRWKYSLNSLLNKRLVRRIAI